MKKWIPDAMFLGGVALAIYGVAHIYTPIAFIIGGIVLAGAGVRLSKGE
jgi:hypothetical protein